MNKTVKYLIATVLVLAGAMWVMSIYKSCNTQKQEDTENVQSNNDSGDNEDIESLYLDDEEIARTEEEDNAFVEENETTGDEDMEEISGEEEDGTVETFDLDENDGEYLVIAGAFISESNAKALQRQLDKKGLESSVKVFLGSSYHAVVLGGYQTQNAAWDIADKIGDEAYVHKKRYPKRMRTS